MSLCDRIGGGCSYPSSPLLLLLPSLFPPDRLPYIGIGPTLLLAACAQRPLALPLPPVLAPASVAVQEGGTWLLEVPPLLGALLGSGVTQGFEVDGKDSVRVQVLLPEGERRSQSQRHVAVVPVRPGVRWCSMPPGVDACNDRATGAEGVVDRCQQAPSVFSLFLGVVVPQSLRNLGGEGDFLRNGGGRRGGGVLNPVGPRPSPGERGGLPLREAISK